MHLAPLIDELLHAGQVLARLTIRLAGLADNDTLYLLTLKVLLQPREEL